MTRTKTSRDGDAKQLALHQAHWRASRCASLLPITQAFVMCLLIKARSSRARASGVGGKTDIIPLKLDLRDKNFKEPEVSCSIPVNSILTITVYLSI